MEEDWNDTLSARTSMTTSRKLETNTDNHHWCSCIGDWMEHYREKGIMKQQEKNRVNSTRLSREQISDSKMSNRVKRKSIRDKSTHHWRLCIRRKLKWNNESKKFNFIERPALALMQKVTFERERERKRTKSSVIYHESHLSWTGKVE